LPESFLQSTEQIDVMCEQIACTSVLMTHGNQDKVVHRTDVLRSADWLRKAHTSMDVQLHTLDKDHAMVNSRREMQILMEFWAKHLHCRMVNLEQNATIYEVSHSQ
jgi:predicted esterase